MEESDYELQRQQNILKNQALLKQLQLDSLSSLNPNKKKASSTSTSRSSTPRPKKVARLSKPPQPGRRSSRLAGIPAEKRQLEEEIKTETASSLESKRRKRLEGDVTFTLSWGDAKIIDPDDNDEADTKSEDSDVKSVRQRLGKLRLRYNDSLPKVTPERSYHLDFHPSTDKALVFSGDKTGVLGILDSTNEEEPEVEQITLHARTISGFVFDRHHAQRLVSASYDGTLRELDLNKGKATEVLALADKDEGISGVQFLGDRRLLWSTLSGEVGAQDPREDKKMETWHCSEKKIGCVATRQEGYTIATASLDRTVKLWDLRKMEEPTTTHENRLSVSSAFFNSKGEVVTTSYDDTIKIYTPELKVKLVVKHNNQTGRWVTILKANWQEDPRDGREKICVGNMGKWIDIIDAATGEVVGMPGRDEEIVTAVPAAARIHPRKDWVAGATASGKVTLFM